MNPTDLSDYLNAHVGIQTSSDTFGQTTLIIFIISMVISAISSFGGNSMEMMWNLMNTLQLIFYISFVYVNYPSGVKDFFKYLKYSNVDNEYLKYMTLHIIPESNFNRGNVNDRIGEKAFYVNSADKLPVLLLIILAFFLTLIFGSIKTQNRGRCLSIFLKVFNFLKYNFFIRFGMEMFLDMTINSMINLYWVSFRR